jgi:phenylalanyl-tRNA synthetase alpha chain
MTNQIEKIKQSFDSEKGLNPDDLKRKYLGKESDLMQILANLKNLSPEEKKEIGKSANELRKYFEEKIVEFSQIDYSNDEKYHNFDVTLPGERRKLGTFHPGTLVAREMNEIFKQLGFSVYVGPEIETDEYVFEKLNLPKNHPARSLQDTLMIEEPEVILRSHTSSVEIRAMENEKLPIRIVVPGRAFRYEDLNQTNHFAFFQYEGLAIGENITMADLKGTFEAFAKSFFGEETKIRIRMKYYPQVEPGCGLDIQCRFCEGAGCPVCKKRGWIETSGGGMVHPNALRAVGIDPEKYSGFAFGMGFDRIVMQKFKIDDIRKLYNGTIY